MCAGAEQCHEFRGTRRHARDAGGLPVSGSLRRTLIIGSAIPIAILVTFILMSSAGLTLNIMTLGGLALGIGMLVDSTIVMLENIIGSA